MKRKYLALAMMTTMVLSMTACGSSAPDSAQTAPAEGTEGTPAEEAQETPAAASGDVVTINVGYENATTEPAAKAVEKWKELVEEKSGGSIVLELFPNSALGKKTDLIDQMIMGENVITVADGAFLADYGVPDFGIFYAPFMFDRKNGPLSILTGMQVSVTSLLQMGDCVYCLPTGSMVPAISCPLNL